MVSEHALPRAPKSADRIDGAIIAGGDILGGLIETMQMFRAVKRWFRHQWMCSVCSGDC